MSGLTLKIPKFGDLNIESGQTPIDLLEELKIPEIRALAANINGRLIDLKAPLMESGDFYIVTNDTEEGLDILRHSSAHVMAHAVMRLFEDVEFAIGPVIEDGFYYDFDLEHQLSTDDFEAIEAEISKIIQEDIPVHRLEMSKDEARKFLQGQNAKFKLELLEEIDETKEKISFYEQKDFTDWCRGPHVNRTGKLKSIKLLNVAGAYWRGDERRDMLQRIYGTAFFNDKALKKHLRLLEEAKKRDHRRIGKDLDIFSLHETSPGMVFWHPAGMVIQKELRKYIDELLFDHGYKEIYTPQLLKSETWKISGHWEHYKDNMFLSEMEEEEYGVKPMNCPGAMTVYKTSLHSFREFPIRLCEWGMVHRHEKRGMMSGMTRVQEFIQDDAHHFCLPEQITGEVQELVRLIKEVYDKLGLQDVRLELSTRPPDSIGTDEMWEMAEKALREALEEIDVDYDVSPGEGAFYGPKIDFHVRDALKRSWQCATVQLDMSMPERFDLEYVGSDNARHRPVLIHRTLVGSLERFIGLLIEHYAGRFPTWLAPVQVMVLPISGEKFGDYAESVLKKLRKRRIRAEIDMRDESLNRRIRDAQLKQVPYMLVVGEREMEEGKVAVRQRNEKRITPVKTQEFIETLETEIFDRKLELGIISTFIKEE